MSENRHCTERHRIQKEEAFHDKWAESMDSATVLVNESFSSCTTPEAAYIASELGDVTGKLLLDLGCGAGEAAVYFAIKGAVVTAMDLSSGMLSVASAVASAHGTTIETAQGSVTDLPFNDNSFDIVYAGNLLHHVDIASTLKEVHRVLKPGGRAAFWDPLGHNPAINVYRQIAIEVRTADEHPLLMKELRHFHTRFSSVTHKCFWLLTLIIFVKFYFIDRVNPNKERYWKKIVTEAEKLSKIYRFLKRLDDFLLGAVPFLGRYCWNIAIICRK